jgi:hypothetical protein
MDYHHDSEVIKVYSPDAEYENRRSRLPREELNISENITEIVKNLRQELDRLYETNADLTKRLQKYTNSDGHKKYYEKNKERVKINGSNYLKKLKLENPTKLKEYAHRAYLNRKEKLFNKKLVENNLISEIII